MTHFEPFFHSSSVLSSCSNILCEQKSMPWTDLEENQRFLDISSGIDTLGTQ